MQEQKECNGIDSNSQEAQHSHDTLDQSKKSQTKNFSSEWEDFSEVIKTPKADPNTEQVTSFQTPENSQKIVETVNPLQQVLETHDREIILAYPIEQIVLHVE